MKSEFLIQRNGKIFVLYAGLLDLAHERGLRDVRVEVVMTRRIRWESVDSNPLWLRGIRCRNPNPTSFTQSMEPERNAVYTEMIPFIDQSNQIGLNVKWLGQALIAFDSEEDLTLFLLRWS